MGDLSDLENVENIEHIDEVTNEIVETESVESVMDSVEVEPLEFDEPEVVEKPEVVEEEEVIEEEEIVEGTEAVEDAEIVEELDKPGGFYEQGINEFGFLGTCGPTSQANAINELLGEEMLTENEVLTVAVDNDLCQVFGEPENCGGTSTEQFMELYGRMNEQLGDRFSTELFDYENVLDADQVAEQLETGSVINVAVDACALWDQPRDYVDDMGVYQDDFYSDHWITVTGVDRSSDGSINGFNIIDSGGGENYVTLDKYNEMCFGTEDHRVLDPTCIVLSKK